MISDTELPVDTAKREPLKTPLLVDVVISPLRVAMEHEAELAGQQLRDEHRTESVRIAPVIPPPLAPIPDTYRPPYVPREYRQAAFEKFDTDIAGAEHKASLDFALRTVKKWTSVAKQERRCMICLVGPQGNGKSTLLYSAVNILAANGIRVFSRPWYRLADELRYGGASPFDPDGVEIDAHALRKQLYRARIVCIDEVRPTSGTMFDDTELAKFACHAWDEGVAVLITTNVSPLANVMGEAAADRFTCVTITAPSNRQVR